MTGMCAEVERISISLYFGRHKETLTLHLALICLFSSLSPYSPEKRVSTEILSMKLISKNHTKKRMPKNSPEQIRTAVARSRASHD